jgi:hypothetical protein
VKNSWHRIRPKLRVLLAVAIACSVPINIWRALDDLRTLPSPGKDDVSLWEARLTGIEAALIRAHYRSGDIGYMPAGVLKGHPRTPTEDINWAIARYVLIPLNVKQDSLDSPFVIADFSGETDRQIPEGFTSVYEEPDGLVLMKKQEQ